MKTFCKVFAPISLTLVLGLSIHAGELNSPPAPSPTPGTSTTSTTAPAGPSVGVNPANVDTVWVVVINLLSMLSLH